MEQVTIKAERRDVGKKGLNRRIRKDGFLPAVLYGQKDQPQGLQVNTKEFTNLMKGASGLNVLINLVIGGESSPVVVMLKDYQTDTLKHTLTHIDLLKIDLKAKVAVHVPIHVSGKAVGIGKGGIVELLRRDIEVRCLPTKIPAQIEVDITNLDLGQSIHVNELPLPEGVEIPQGAEYALVSVVTPKVEEAPAVVEAAAVPAEGAVAPAAGAAPAAGEAKASDKGDKKEKK